MKKNYSLIGVIVYVFLVWIVVLVLAFGCNTEKHIVKERVVVDSTAIKEKSDSIWLLKREIERMEAQIREMTYTQVLFDTVYIAGDTIVNTVIIKDNGEVEAAGRIKSLTISKQLLVNIIKEKDRVIDSLAALKQKEKIVVQKETVTKKVDKKSKLVGIGVGAFLLLLVFVVGVFTGWKTKMRFFNNKI